MKLKNPMFISWSCIKGRRYGFAIWDERLYDTWLGIRVEEYALGKTKPHYPVPAKLFCPCLSCTRRIMNPNQ